MGHNEGKEERAAEVPSCLRPAAAALGLKVGREEKAIAATGNATPAWGRTISSAATVMLRYHLSHEAGNPQNL